MSGVSLLRNIARQLGRRSPKVIPSEKRASVAVIFRVESNLPNSSTCSKILNFSAGGKHISLPFDNEEEQSSSPVLECLFIKRAMITKDPWSGNVALPGGKQDEQDGGDDYETAVRETREEVGVDLDDSKFLYLGQMDDRKITGKGKVIKGFTMVPHVFLQEPGLQRPKINIQTEEVAGCRWVDFSVINGNNVCWNDVKRENAAGSFLFPSISLPSTGDVTETEHLDFILWGLTYAVCSDMLVLGGGECINTPQYKVADALTTGSWYEKQLP